MFFCVFFNMQLLDRELFFEVSKKDHNTMPKHCNNPILCSFLVWLRADLQKPANLWHTCIYIAFQNALYSHLFYKREKWFPFIWIWCDLEFLVYHVDTAKCTL